MKCPICQQHELREYAWLSDAEGVYKSDDHYDCANCGPIDKEHGDHLTRENLRGKWRDERIAELEAQLAEVREALRHIRQAPSQHDNALEAMHEMAQMADDALAGEEVRNDR